MAAIKRAYDFLWCLTLLVPMAWRLTSEDWDIEFSNNGFTGKRTNSKEQNDAAS